MNPQQTMPQPNTDEVYYLASPYSHPDPVIKEMRYTIVTAIGAALSLAGFLTIEPIGASHPVAKTFKLPTGYEFWKRRDRALISHSDGVIVAMMDGWQESVGVTDEIQFAESIGKPVYYLDPKKFLREYPLSA